VQVFSGGNSTSSNQDAATSKVEDKDQNSSQVRQKAILGRCQTMKATSCMLTPTGFQQRIRYFTDKDDGVLHEKVEKQDMAEVFMSNPDMMNSMMKQQLGGLGPQLALGAFVNYFFRGFILGKLPFSLSPKFRGMLQSGIDLPSLDVTYLSSLSYYMLLLFGSRGILTLFFKDVVNDAALAAQMQQKGMNNPMMMMGADPQKQIQDELKAMDLLQHRWQMQDAEVRALHVLKKKIV
jgi:hypothetical protein